MPWLNNSAVDEVGFLGCCGERACQAVLDFVELHVYCCYHTFLDQACYLGRHSVGLKSLGQKDSLLSHFAEALSPLITSLELLCGNKGKGFEHALINFF